MEAASGTSTCEKEHLACEYSDVTVDSPLDDLAGAVKMVPDVVKQVRAQKKLLLIVIQRNQSVVDYHYTDELSSVPLWFG